MVYEEPSNESPTDEQREVLKKKYTVDLGIYFLMGNS